MMAITSKARVPPSDGATEFRFIRTSIKDVRRFSHLRDGARWKQLHALGQVLEKAAKRAGALHASRVQRNLQEIASIREREEALAASVRAVRQAFAGAKKKKLLRNAVESRFKNPKKARRLIAFIERAPRPPGSLANALARRQQAQLKSLEHSFVRSQIYALRSYYEPAIRLSSSTLGVSLGAARRTTKLLSTFVDSYYRKLYEALTGNRSASRVRHVANKILSRSNQISKEPAAKLGGLLRQLSSNEMRTGRKRVGSVAVDLSESLARLEVLVAYAAYLAIRLQRSDAQQWIEQERDHAKKRKFASAVPVGPKKCLGMKYRASAGLVQFEGKVHSLRMIKDPAPPKESSIFDLVDPDSGEKIGVRAHMFSLRNNGLSNGSYCRVNGYLHKALTPRLRKIGQVILDIDRVELSALRKRSWIDSVIWRMRPFVRLFRDEMNIFFTPRLRAQK